MFPDKVPVFPDENNFRRTSGRYKMKSTDRLEALSIPLPTSVLYSRKRLFQIHLIITKIMPF
jgi:hypothetical protein